MESKQIAQQFHLTDAGEFEVVFATKRDSSGDLVIDRDGDVYFDGAVGVQHVTIGCINHSSSCTSPAGYGKTHETASDIRVRGRLALDTEHGRYQYDIWKALGERAEFSYTFTVVEAETVEVRGRRHRGLKRLVVYSIDLVQNPAGVGTGIVALKSACGCSASCSCGGLSDAEKQRLLSIKAQLTLRRQKADFHALQVKHRLQNLRRDFNAGAFMPYRFVYCQPSKAAEDAANYGAGIASFEYEVYPSLRFFRLAEPGEKADFTHDRLVLGAQTRGTNFIDVRADLDAKTAAIVAFHEASHLAHPEWSEEQVQRETQRRFTNWLDADATALSRVLHGSPQSP